MLMHDTVSLRDADERDPVNSENSCQKSREPGRVGPVRVDTPRLCAMTRHANRVLHPLSGFPLQDFPSLAESNEPGRHSE